MDNGIFTPEVKKGGAWSWPFNSNTEDKNMWSYTSTPPYVFIAWCLIKHTEQVGPMDVQLPF
jgi:hypothetical protein